MPSFAEQEVWTLFANSNRHIVAWLRKAALTYSVDVGWQSAQWLSVVWLDGLRAVQFRYIVVRVNSYQDISHISLQENEEKQNQGHSYWIIYILVKNKSKKDDWRLVGHT